MDEDNKLAFFTKFRHSQCFDSCYPMKLFPEEKELDELSFSDITIFCGGNGSGKTTLLNIIAETLKLNRITPFNKTYFFDPYTASCDYELSIKDPIKLRDLMNKSKIITSDDVFNHIIKVREKNENIDFKRQVIIDEKESIGKYGYTRERPKGFNTDDPESMKAYINYADFLKHPTHRLVRDKVGYSERTYSNGENGFKYFINAIQPGGLYLLDEPENSLSAEMQLELVQFLQNMARFYNCQFVISTHSPFILSLPFAKIYHLDTTPVEICKWTDLPNVRIFHEFFKAHESEF